MFTGLQPSQNYFVEQVRLTKETVRVLKALVRAPCRCEPIGGSGGISFHGNLNKAKQKMPNTVF